MNLLGREVRLDSVMKATQAGIVLVPEDRQQDGLVPELSVRENMVLAAAGERWLSRAKETERVMQLVRKLRIAVRDLELPVTALSGGNQQKVLLARCLMRSPARAAAGRADARRGCRTPRRRSTACCANLPTKG